MIWIIYLSSGIFGGYTGVVAASFAYISEVLLGAKKQNNGIWSEVTIMVMIVVLKK